MGLCSFLSVHAHILWGSGFTYAGEIQAEIVRGPGGSHVYMYISMKIMGVIVTFNAVRRLWSKCQYGWNDGLRVFTAYVPLYVLI